MAIAVSWPTKIISIPKSYLTPLGGLIYQLDIEQFRLDLKDLEDNEQGISYPDTHRRNAPVTIAGATYAQTFEVINGYTITFEDGQYAVNLYGANSNISEVTNVNQVSIRSFNSAGLIVVETGGGGSGSPSMVEDLTGVAVLVAGAGPVGQSAEGAVIVPGAAAAGNSGAPAIIEVGQGAVIQ